ncbi:MAG: HAMP domain-containing protein [Magnetococcales bacterium]|nr:HAMP domain-containing protein [Magnetococcales bacterium]
MNTLSIRVILTLLIGLTFSHILSILIFSSEKLEGSVLKSESQVLERMAAVIHLMMEVPVAHHQTLLKTLNHGGMYYHISDSTAAGSEWPGMGSDEGLRQRLEQRIALPEVRVVAVEIRPPDWNHAHGSAHRLLFAMEVAIIRMMHDTVLDEEIHARVALPGGQRVWMSSLPADNHVPLFRHATISVVLMTGAIFLFALGIARHLTRPFARIVQAADRFGQDLHAPPLPEEGAMELITVARAFNRMNRRIREFVEERLRMIAAISHDLRTPLTRLKLMAEFVGDEATRGRMVATLDEMEAMLAVTLTMAREANSPEPKQQVNLSGLLSSICADLTDAGLFATCDESARHLFSCRPLAMKRALTNLIHNAVKFGGAAQVSLQREAERLLITIRDSGPGIPEREWENVFKPFLRLESMGGAEADGVGLGGVGLGLSIASSVIREHDGVIRFFYPPEGGFATRVELWTGRGVD